MKTTRLMRYVGLAAAGTSLLSACSVSAPNVQQKSGSGNSATCPVAADKSIHGTIKIGYQQIPNGDLIVKHRRMLETCAPNASIQWTQYSSGASVVQAFGSNSADIALLGSSPVTKTLSPPLNSQMKVKVVWIQDVIGKAESLVAKDAKVKSLTDLKGKKIAVPFGSTSHYSVLAALKQAGMKESDVTLVNLDPDKMPAAWASSQVDAAWVWDPTLSALLKSGHVVTSSEVTAKAGSPTYDLEGATTSFISKNAAFMKIWAACEDAADKQINSDPSAAADAMSADLGLAPADIKKQLAGYKYLPASEQKSSSWLGGKLGNDLYATAQFLKDQGDVTGVAPKGDYTGAIDAGPAGGVK